MFAEGNIAPSRIGEKRIVLVNMEDQATGGAVIEADGARGLTQSGGGVLSPFIEIRKGAALIQNHVAT